MVNPNGGEKDIDPPKLIKAIPNNFSTNFKATKIELTFDEYLSLKDVQNQLIVSPSDVEIEVKKKGKKIILELKNKPKDSSTYIINFGESIADYTENNINKEFKYIFSTNQTIDSLVITGTVKDAYTKEIPKEVLLCLYKDYSNDSIIYKKKPDYTVRLNDKGMYMFTNLKSNQYKLIALKETNNNKIYDSQEEQIAFLDSTLILNSNLVIKDLYLFTEIPTQKKLLNKEIVYKKVELTYNKKNNAELINIDKYIDTIIYSNKKDSIKIYYKNKVDTSVLYIKDNEKIDTLKIKFSKNLKPKELNITSDNKINDDEILIKTKELFNIYKKDSIQLWEDSVLIKYELTKKDYNIYSIKYKFDKERKYKLYICDSAFISYDSSYNKQIKNSLVYMNEEDYGTLNISTQINKNIIYELIDESNNIIRRTTAKFINNFTYHKLTPGTYRLRMIYDDNNNSVWDTGDYLTNMQPEKIIYYVNPIKVRANWDLEIVITP